MQVVDILSIPTQGKLLIEASAGTGKTYTITSLAIRLLIDHLLSDAPQKTIEQLLIVTFTKSATEELRERIQKRIHQARLFLDPDHQDDSANDDAFLNDLKAALGEQQHAAYLALLQAERMVHHANIFTIHSFCTRLLKQFSLETKHLLDVTLNENEHDLLTQFAQQLWRDKVYNSRGLERALYKHVLGNSPEQVIGTLSQWKSRATFTFKPQLDDLESRIAQVAALEAEFIAAWTPEVARTIEARLLEIKKGRSYTKKNIPNWVGKVSAFVASSQGHVSLMQEKSLDKLSFNRIQEHCQTALDLAPSMIRPLEIIDELLALHPTLNYAKPTYLHARYQAFLRDLMLEKRELTFSSLLNVAAQAIAPEDQSLIAEITRSYPVAIIDEFQDTDPEQFHIFDSVFGHTTSTSASALYMIGDPKQAIYAFRGGDIYTYLFAKSRATAQFTLNSNWRSTPAMVNAINHVFSQHDDPFLHEAIPYPNVLAANDASAPLHINDRPEAALTWFTHTARSHKAKDYQIELAYATANHIAQCLAHGVLDEAPIAENQIAILVHNGQEAQLMKYALDQHQLPYTYFSEKQHVYQTEQAQQLLYLLQAIDAPKNLQALKTLLASALVGLPLSRIQALDNDADALNTWQQLLSHCAQQLQQHSVFNALHDFYQQQQTITRLQAQADGKQKAANLLQLTELLHEAHPKEKHIPRLIQFIQQQRQSTDEQADLRQRIGSTDSRINIYTLHKCKGLEFDIVYIPFLSAAKGLRENKNTVYFYHDQQHQLIADLNADEQAQAQARDEALAEQIRLCYVGMTRSKHACYIGLMPHDSLQDSALGHLLSINESNYTDVLAALCTHPDIAQQVIDTHTEIKPVMRAANPTATPISIRKFTNTLETHWRISSYTQLSQKPQHGNASAPPALHAAHEHSERIDDADSASIVEDNTSRARQHLSRYHFPKGAHAGLFWHEWLEHIDIDAEDRMTQAQALLPALCQRYGIELLWQDTLMDWLDAVLTTPLEATHKSADETRSATITLGSLGSEARINEMEFLFPIAQLSEQRINNVLAQSTLSRQVPAQQKLSFATFQGFLKGFIDLTFVHNGQYYIADYKSNYLGNSAADYQYEALLANVLSHRYDVQLLLYVFALHRYLKARLPDYDYAQHIGGAYYFYLRGMNGGASPDSANGVFFHKPDFAVISAFEQLISQEEQH